MKFQLTILGLAVLAFAKPQASDPAELPAPVPVPSSQPTPPSTPVPVPPADPAPAPPASSTSPPPPDGPICECGYTYCASVLKAMGMCDGYKNYTTNTL